MHYFSRSAAVTGLVVSLVGGLGAVSPHAAVADCSAKAAGTYLTTIIDAGGSFASRSTLRLGADGTLSSVDSGQGIVGFTEAQGTWTCDGKKDLVATALDFNTAGTSIFRADGVASIDKTGRTVEGTITQTAFPIGDNPFTGQGTTLGSFSFTGERIPASVE